jgi:hypothetical protein
VRQAAIRLGSISAGFLLMCILGCDSPPWSRCIIVNSSNEEMLIRFYTPHASIAAPCVYSPDDWEHGSKSCSYRGDQGLTRNDKENWFEGKIPPGGAVEIDRARYPDIEENTDKNFLIDRLDIRGSGGDIAWAGRSEIFGKLAKEGGGGLLLLINGGSPRYIYYYH